MLTYWQCFVLISIICLNKEISYLSLQELDFFVFLFFNQILVLDCVDYYFVCIC